MQHLRRLLSIENSELAKILRFSLYGLEASLKKACAEFSEDSGAKICDEVLQELNHILLPDKIDITTSKSELKLTALRDEFDADKELALYIGNSPLQSQTDSDLWQEINRKLLRVPEDLATYWRQHALNLASLVGAIEDNLDCDKLPFIRDEIIYPGLSGSVSVKGLELSQKELSNYKFAHGQQSPDMYLIACMVILLIKFIEIEPDLHHALKSVFSFDIVSLHSKPEQRTQYIEALSDRLQRTLKLAKNTDPLLTLRAWIDIDEAIHSLIFIPPCDRYSWWGKLQQESRRILKKVADKANNAGYNVRIRQLSGVYADICAFSQDDLQLDYGGTPGEVLSCLRVYARINQEDSPGRVIFRTSR